MDGIVKQKITPLDDTAGIMFEDRPRHIVTQIC